MDDWTIRYVQSFQREFLGKSGTIKDAFETRLEILRTQPVEYWKKTSVVGMFKGDDCKGLLKLRFLADDVQQRPIGFYGLGRMTFTFVLWTVEKGGRYVPRDFCRLAQLKIREIKEGKESTYVWEFEE